MLVLVLTLIWSPMTFTWSAQKRAKFMSTQPTTPALFTQFSMPMRHPCTPSSGIHFLKRSSYHARPTGQLKSGIIVSSNRAIKSQKIRTQSNSLFCFDFKECYFDLWFWCTCGRCWLVALLLGSICGHYSGR